MTMEKATALDRWGRRRMAIPSDAPLSKATLDAYSLVGLRETLAHALRCSPFYRRRLPADAPDRLVRTRDIASLPFTTEADLQNDPLSFLSVSQDRVARVFTLTTSGTTAAPKRVFFTENDLAATIDFFSAGMAAAAGPGRRAMILLPGGAPDSVGELLTRALALTGAESLVHGPVDDLARTAAAVRSARPDCLVGIPVQVLALSRFAGDAKTGFGTVQNVMLTGDHVAPAAAAAVSRRWNCRVYTHYGMTEMGFGGAVSCSAGKGLHLRAADLFFEIIDPDTGDPAQEGALGEVVFTTFGREAMPLVRYRTGDMARWIPGPCPCGCRLPRISAVFGRRASAPRIGKHGQLYPADLDAALFPIDGILDYVAELREENGRACLSVRLGISPVAHASVIETAHRRLRRVAALHAAAEDGTLYVARPEPVPGRLFTRGWKKRVIEDLRPKERMP